jgi:ATP-dependent RNA helicase DeaD
LTTISTFDTLGLQPALIRALRDDLKFTEPTPIQVLAIPPALEGRDVLASAETGSGKSAAFGLPILSRLLGLPRGKTRVLILAPTRELTDQIAKHLKALAAHTDIRIAAVFGGVGFGPQVDAFKRGADIIVATPGRLLDHLRQGTARLNDISMLVLDEADRMLDMGFLPDVRRVIARLPAKRQTLFFSATLPPAVSALVRDMLVDPAKVELAKKSAPVSTLTQRLYAVPQEQKTDLLLELLKDNEIFSAIAFTRTKARANRLAAALEKRRIPSDLIHGDRSQSQRTRALENFKRGKYRVLVATDIAARGIDVDHISHVVNFDVPPSVDVYVHRTGRTGRAGREGVALTFAEPRERAMLRNIENVTKRKLVLLPVPSVADLRARQVATLRESIVTMLESDKVARYRDAVASLSQDHDPAEIAAAALAVADRANERAEEEIPGVEERPFVAKAGPRPKRIVRAADAGLLAKILIGLGRQAGVRPGDLVGAIANEAGLDSKQIGSIDIGDRFSLVEVPDALADRVVTALRDTSIRGRRTLVRRDRGARS